jgi:hypothetical protein
MTFNRTFLNGFLIGLFIFLIINLIAAHLFSDCGLPALLGASSCADDISRAGFPLIFLEQGGFVSRNIFNPSNLLFDIFIGFDIAFTSGFIASWREKRNIRS